MPSLAPPPAAPQGGVSCRPDAGPSLGKRCPGVAAGAASEARVPGFQTRRRYFPDTGRRSPRDPFAGDPLLTGSKRGRRTGSGCARTAPTHPPTHCCELCRWREGALAWEWPPRDSWQENGDLVTDKETDLPCRDGVPAHAAALAWWPFVSFSASS